MRNPECPTGKKKIGDQASAELRVRMMERKFPHKFQYYICRVCGFYHVAHKIPAIVRKNERKLCAK